jgi:hypothetical protein
MKKITALVSILLLAMNLFAQLPEKMSYQAIVRNNNDKLVVNALVSMRISILKGASDGAVVYSEAHQATTNANGLVGVDIGTGTIVSGSFATIDWSEGPYFLKTETDPAGGTYYSIVGTSQLLSVPYSFYAKTAESLKGGITETDPTFAVSPAQTITAAKMAEWDNKLSKEIDGSITNELQVISISNDTIYLSDGGFVKLPSSSNSFGFAQGDSLVLKDSSGDTRMVLNPNTGTFKMMDNDTVWYVLKVNSPPSTLTQDQNGVYTEHYSEGNYSKFFVKDGERYNIEDQKTSSRTENINGVDTEITTTEKNIYANNQLTEKSTTTRESEKNGYNETSTKVRFNQNGEKMSETVSETKGGLAMGFEQTTITNRYFDSSGKVISETTQVKKQDYFGNKVSNESGDFFSSTTTPLAVVFGNSGSTNTLQVGSTSDGKGFTVGLNDGTPNPPILNFNSDPVYGGWFELSGASVGIDAHNTFTTGGLDVLGSLNVNGTKNFRIVNPLDTLKYLLHASIESNEVLNQYSGNVLTDANGEASVQLPSYFQEINTDFRYQLTVIGTFAQAIVLKEIEGNWFSIKTDKPNVKVSWQVTAKRNDPYMKEHPFSDEAPR